jgi:hypothetical protein
MLRKVLVTAGVGALVAMAIGGASFASASGGGGGRTIVVIEKSTSGHFRDVGKAGPTAGDEFFFRSQFWNTPRTHKIGSNHGYCVFQNTTVLHCVGTARLLGGTIEYSFTDTLTTSAPLPAITGGTGTFDGAEGHITIHNLNSDGSLSRDTIVLLG